MTELTIDELKAHDEEAYERAVEQLRARGWHYDDFGDDWHDYFQTELAAPIGVELRADTITAARSGDYDFSARWSVACPARLLAFATAQLGLSQNAQRRCALLLAGLDHVRFDAGRGGVISADGAVLSEHCYLVAGAGGVHDDPLMDDLVYTVHEHLCDAMSRHARADAEYYESEECLADLARASDVRFDAAGNLI